MKTVVIKIPTNTVPNALDYDLKETVRLRKWCHEHIKNGWHSFFLGAAEQQPRTNFQAVFTDKTYNGRVGFIGFDFTDPKEAMKFKLWAGSGNG